MTPPRRPEDHIIFPLDVASRKEALILAEKLSGKVGLFKIGLELFIRCGPDIVRAVSAAGPARVFLDLKLHDIPETVSRAVRAVADLEVVFATVHCGDSMAMLEAATAAGKGKVQLLGVTLLTHLSGKALQSAGYAAAYRKDAALLVLQRAAMAKKAGCAGVICSGLEVKNIKETLGHDFLAVTPGIRPSWEPLSRDDQVRIVTPGQAIREGADYLVIGRPIRDAEDPGRAAERVAEEIHAALKSSAAAPSSSAGSSLRVENPYGGRKKR